MCATQLLSFPPRFELVASCSSLTWVIHVPVPEMHDLGSRVASHGQESDSSVIRGRYMVGGRVQCVSSAKWAPSIRCKGIGSG